ncbi:MAG TPA: TolC family protein [Stenomitos sp.]
MGTTPLWATLSAAMLLVSANPAGAQGNRLTLNDAVRSALATSSSLRGAEAKVEGARARIDEASSHQYPTVSVGLTPLHLGILDPSLNAMLNSFAPGLSPNMLSEMLTVSQVLYDGGRSQLGRQAAETGTEMAAQGVKLTRQNVAFDVANSYLTVLRTESLLQTTVLAQRQAEQHLKDAQLREQAGAGSHFDTLQAQTAVALVQGRLIQARNAVRLSRISLATAIHQPVADRSLDPNPALPVVAVDLAGLERGLEQRPEVEIAKRQSRVDALTTEISARDRLPVAAVQGIVLGQGTSIPAYVVMGSLNWTLYDGGKTEAKVKQGEMSTAADEASLTSLREGLRLEIEKAIADRDEAKERIAAAEQGLKTAQAGFDLANLRYTEGAGTGSEVIDATSALSQAQAGYVQATYDEYGAELRLAKALGVDLASQLSGL